MSNRLEELYKTVFNSIIQILTQNYIYTLSVLCITTDTEYALINAIKSIFMGVRCIGCWYYMKANLNKFAKFCYLLNKKNKKINTNITKEIIKRLAMICLDYKGSMDYFDFEIKNIESQYNKEYYPLISYFLENKLKFFADEDYNYNAILEDIRTNSSLERYNKELKKYVCNKKNCNWFIFLNTINNELLRIKDIITKNQNKNVRYYSKKTKFSLKILMKLLIIILFSRYFYK